MPTINPIVDQLADQRGFTLIEALVAIFILIVGIVSLYSMQLGAIHGNARADSLSRLSNWATTEIESRINQNYGELLSRNGAGANCDVNGDGIDDVDPQRQCGLNNPLVGGVEPNYQLLGFDCAKYTGWDLCTASPDGTGLIFLNIAENMPAPNIKTIRVKVVTRDFGQQPVVSKLTYFRSNNDIK